MKAIQTVLAAFSVIALCIPAFASSNMGSISNRAASVAPMGTGHNPWGALAAAPMGTGHNPWGALAAAPMGTGHNPWGALAAAPMGTGHNPWGA